MAKRRVERLGSRSIALGPYIARRHLLELEAVYGDREENEDKLLRMAERQRAEGGEEDLADVVGEVLRAVGWSVWVGTRSGLGLSTCGML